MGEGAEVSTVLSAVRDAAVCCEAFSGTDPLMSITEARNLYKNTFFDIWLELMCTISIL